MELSQKHCQVCEGGVPALSADEINQYLPKVPAWQIDADHKHIIRRFEFKGFQKAVMFANAVAWIASSEGHHPEIKFGVGYCEVIFTTHAVNGLTDNDFICAAKVDKLLN